MGADIRSRCGLVLADDLFLVTVRRATERTSTRAIRGLVSG
jgi:hypothetical protein